MRASVHELSYPPDFCTGCYGRIWQNARFLIDDNTIELARRPEEGWEPRAVSLGVSGVPPQFHIRRAAVRGTVVRHGEPPLPNWDDANLAVVVSGNEEVLVQDSLIDLLRLEAPSPASPLWFRESLQRLTSMNLTPKGQIVRAGNKDCQSAPDTGTAVQTELDEAFVFAFLK